MTAYSAFYPFIVPDLPGCPEIGIDTELARIANKFCAATWTYRVDVTESVQSGDTSISPTLPNDTQLVGVVSAEIDDFEFYDFTISGDSIVLDEAATSDYDVALTIAVKPSLSAGIVPDVLFRDHMDAIAHGVKARLFLSPQKSWTNPDLATYHQRFYDDAAGANMAIGFCNSTSTQLRIERRGYL